MSNFAVTVERIEKVYPHENADSLELAKLEGLNYQFVVPKGQYEAGDLAVYFPLDSLIPEEILEQIGLSGRLSGSKKNRVKTVRLRGALSEGVLASPLELNIALIAIENIGTYDLAPELGVTKYEPPVHLDNNARTRSLPPEIEYYDIENAQRYPEVVESLMSVPCFITEKLEGSNYAAMLKDDGTFVVCTHRQQVEEIEGHTHTWWEVTRKQKILELCNNILEDVEGASNVIIRGEVCGPKIQGNIYGLKQHELYVFDIEINSMPVNADVFIWYADEFDIQTVPLIAYDCPLQEWILDMTLQDTAEGESLLAEGVEREGIIIRPMEEVNLPGFGRVILKQKSATYLLGQKA